MNNWNKLFELKPPTGSTINNVCDHVYFLNLDKRKDRLDSITNQLINNNIIAERFPAIIGTKTKTTSAAQNGCLLSHLAIIKDAINKKYKSIAIFEDDTVFKESFIYNFDLFMSNMVQDWDMIYLTGNHHWGLSKVNSVVFRSYGTLTTSAYIIKNTIYKFLVKILNSKRKPIDSYFCENHHKINTYVAVPSLTYQLADFSDIENKYVDYSFLK